VSRELTKAYVPVALSAILIAAALLAYSQTYAFAWDEGFHLLAAQLIARGKRPYLDFLFAQTPLNAYWNAAWMRIFGESWRTAHIAAALETAAASWLTADYVFRRFPVAAWRSAAAVATMFVVGLNVVVFEYGTIGQAYGFCLLLSVMAFRFAVAAVGRVSPFFAGLAGAASGASASASLLTVTIGPVLLIWILISSRAERRLTQFIAFAAGGLVASAPVVWFLAQSPGQVIFDVVDYHLHFRQVYWNEWILHDLEVMTAWLDSSHALFLGLLAGIGLIFIRRAGWDRRLRSELHLCAWLGIFTGLYLMTAHPTFPRYFLFVTPFAGILAATGLYAIATRLSPFMRDPALSVILLGGLMALGLGRSLYEDRVDYSWDGLAELARKVDLVTPPGAPLYADEIIYFMTKRIPPSGMEWNSGHKVELSEREAAELHVLPRKKLDREVKAGRFATLETCEDSDIDRLELEKIYRQKAVAGNCTVFWDKRVT
jgi:hypothetical protein